MNPYQYIRENCIEFSREKFRDIDGISVAIGTEKYIWVKEWLTEIQEREILAHEIWHFETDTVSYIHAGKYYENLAEKKWSELLIPADEVFRAIEENEGVCDVSFLAPLFWVSFDYMKKRILSLWNIK